MLKSAQWWLRVVSDSLQPDGTTAAQSVVSDCLRAHGTTVTQSVSGVWFFATPWYNCSPPGFSLHGIFSRLDYWNGLPFPSPGDLPNPRIKSASPAWQADSLPLSREGRPLLIPDCPITQGRTTEGWPSKASNSCPEECKVSHTQRINLIDLDDQMKIIEPIMCWLKKNANTCLGQTKVAQAWFTKPSHWLLVNKAYFLGTTKLHPSAWYDHTVL